MSSSQNYYSQDVVTRTTLCGSGSSSVLKVTGILHLVLGVVLIILGFAAIVLTAWWSHYSIPIWTGILIFGTTGVLGILVSENANKKKNLAYISMCLLSMLVCIMMVILFSIAASKEPTIAYFMYNYVPVCNPSGSSRIHYNCDEPVTGRQVIDSLIVVTAFIEGIVSIVGAAEARSTTFPAKATIATTYFTDAESAISSREMTPGHTRIYQESVTPDYVTPVNVQPIARHPFNVNKYYSPEEGRGDATLTPSATAVDNLGFQADEQTGRAPSPDGDSFNSSNNVGVYFPGEQIQITGSEVHVNGEMMNDDVPDNQRWPNEGGPTVIYSRSYFVPENAESRDDHYFGSEQSPPSVIDSPPINPVHSVDQQRSPSHLDKESAMHEDSEYDYQPWPGQGDVTNPRDFHSVDQQRSPSHLDKESAFHEYSEYHDQPWPGQGVVAQPRDLSSNDQGPREIEDDATDMSPSAEEFGYSSFSDDSRDESNLVE